VVLTNVRKCQPRGDLGAAPVRCGLVAASLDIDGDAVGGGRRSDGAVVVVVVEESRVVEFREVAVVQGDVNVVDSRLRDGHHGDVRLLGGDVLCQPLDRDWGIVAPMIETTRRRRSVVSTSNSSSTDDSSVATDRTSEFVGTVLLIVALVHTHRVVYLGREQTGR